MLIIFIEAPHEAESEEVLELRAALEAVQKDRFQLQQELNNSRSFYEFHDRRALEEKITSLQKTNTELKVALREANILSDKKNIEILALREKLAKPAANQELVAYHEAATRLSEENFALKTEVANLQVNLNKTASENFHLRDAILKLTNGSR